MGQNNWRLAKTQISGTDWDSLWEVKYYQKPNPCFQTVIHRPNLCYYKISKRKLKKEYTISSGTGKNTTS